MYRNLQKIMEQNKVTYTQIAEIIGCDYRAVSDTIKGIKNLVSLLMMLKNKKCIISRIRFLFHV